jgi:hypothetical protein
MKVCREGHKYRGDENYRARRGWCPVCFKEAQARYARSAKAKARHKKYDSSEKGRERSARHRETDKRADALARYDQSPKGWLNVLRKRRTEALKARKRRQEAEDLG